MPRTATTKLASILTAGLATAAALAAEHGPLVVRRTAGQVLQQPPAYAAAPSGTAATSHEAASAPLAWSPVSLYGGETTSVAVDPNDARIVYVGTRDAGVFKSRDGGLTWAPSRQGLTFYPIRSLVVDAWRPATVWAGTDNDGVWKSNDAGASWQHTAPLPDSMIVFNLALDPRNGDVAYAACAGGVALSIGGIWKTTDGGTSWVKAENGIPRYNQYTDYTSGVFSFALDAAHPDTLLAGTVLQGVFRSADGGASWTAISQGVPPRYGGTDPDEINALAFDPHHVSRPSAVMAGKYYTFDGASWVLKTTQAYSSGLGFMSSVLAFHPTIPDVVFVGGAGAGFEKSTDGGVTWTSVDTGVQISALAVSRSTPGVLFGAQGGEAKHMGCVAASNDAGDHWTRRDAGLLAADVQSVAADPTDARHLYAGTGGGQVFASHNGGASWSAGCNGAYTYQDICDFGDITSIAVDPRDPTLVSVAGFSGFFQSRDRGARLFEVEAVNAPTSIAVSAATNPTTYFVASDNRGVYRSTDGGASWVNLSSGLPSFGSSLCPVLTVAIDPNDVRTVWVGTQYGGGIARTTDSGEHWTPRGLDQTNWVNAISVRPGNSQEVLAGGGYSYGEVYKSTDGGATWQTKLSEIGFVQQFLRDPGNPDVVYAASEGFGVMRSSDGGETWADVTGSIFYPLVYSVALTTGAAPRLLAGSYGSGLYQAPLAGGGGRTARRHPRR